jgi:hypothetical protein
LSRSINSTAAGSSAQIYPTTTSRLWRRSIDTCLTAVRDLHGRYLCG